MKIQNHSNPKEMKTKNFLILLFVVWKTSGILLAQVSDYILINTHIYTSAQIDSLLRKPECLQGYLTNQTGYLTKIDSGGTETFDTTFSVQQMKIPSDNIFINGWLYLPSGNGKFPLIVMTNGGGNITRNLRSFSDWLAPVLAHCGIAAFVHDKRGTGESGGIFAQTTYEDYIRDAGNCAVFLSIHENINPEMIGVAGASEGGRIAVLAASRYPEIKFVISFEGTFVSAVDDRINAQKGWLQSLNLPDSTFSEVLDLHIQSILTWASDDPEKHNKLKPLIYEMREKYDDRLLPYLKEEMDSIPDFETVLPTWYSLKYDYLSEMENFTKKWLAMFGESDPVVPTRESVENMIHYMQLSGNKNYNIAVIPDCGHGIINLKTNQIIRINHLIIHWVNGEIIDKKVNY